MRALDARGIAYAVVPGVSSFVTAAAALPAELTLPGVSQTVIVTRQAGRTPVPDGQDLSSLAAHRATMAVFLSVGDLGGVVAALLEHYPPSTPTAIVQRASWPEQLVLRGSLATIAAQAAEAGVDRTAMVLVGDVLRNEGEDSLLYDAGFSHGYRQATAGGGEGDDMGRRKGVGEAGGSDGGGDADGRKGGARAPDTSIDDGAASPQGGAA
jgi:precorrin-4/cobalt-precorrin-4 C11-methyltransferase